MGLTSPLNMPTAIAGEEPFELDSISTNPLSNCGWYTTVTVCEALVEAEMPERSVPMYVCIKHYYTEYIKYRILKYRRKKYTLHVPHCFVPAFK